MTVDIKLDDEGRVADYGADVKAEPANDAAPDAFVDALLDDLNTPKALAVLFDLAKQANTASDPGTRAQLKAALIGAGRMIGILEMDPEAWFAGGGAASSIRLACISPSAVQSSG